MKPVEAAPELQAFLNRPENAAFLEFYGYWRRKGAGRVMPGRADIDPLDIPRLLPNVFLMDVVPGTPRRFRFRLVGTRIAELEGEMTDRFLDEFVPGAAGTAMARHYDETAEGRISARHETLHWRKREYINYDVLLLPLSSDGETVDMLFGLARYQAK
ncbi:MAG TPA: PAS domain-containing protein [Candidatus Acidoferrum sp.]|nr:PAS domain-containing protein [Candidatus Acidoferrum sp.]